MIALRASGPSVEAILADESLVSRVIRHADEMEVAIVDRADSQALLRSLVETGATITKLEKVEPSLNDIFIDKVTA